MTENIIEFNLNSCLKEAIKLNASDIHLRSGDVPIIRNGSALTRLDMPILTERDLGNIIQTILPKGLRNKASYAYDLDFSYEIKDVSRFRVNLCRQMGHTSLVFRVIPLAVKSFADLNLPALLAKFADFQNGIILVTGPTGCGKSTTIASLVEYINQTRQKHIITIEDPVEYVYQSKNSLITQRQVGLDTESFYHGIKYAMRQDPDILVIGEIRDRETVDAALQAAETGHLVLATLHTNDAISTVNRLINMLDTKNREYTRHQVAGTLRATISQRLINTTDGKGKLPACEVMVATSTVEDLIRKNELDKIYELIKYGQYTDMLTMNHSLNLLASGKLISQQDAIMNSNRPTELQQMLKGAYHGTRE